MSVRVYLPTTLTGLAGWVRDQQVAPLGGTAFAVTAGLAGPPPMPTPRNWSTWR